MHALDNLHAVGSAHRTLGKGLALDLYPDDLLGPLSGDWVKVLLERALDCVQISGVWLVVRDRRVFERHHSRARWLGGCGRLLELRNALTLPFELHISLLLRLALSLAVAKQVLQVLHRHAQSRDSRPGVRRGHSRVMTECR